MRAHISRALALEWIDVDDQIGQLGLDSLMALEVRNAVDRELGVSLPVVALMDGSSIRSLGALILASLRAAVDDEAGDATARADRAGEAPSLKY